MLGLPSICSHPSPCTLKLQYFVFCTLNLVFSILIFAVKYSVWQGYPLLTYLPACTFNLQYFVFCVLYFAFCVLCSDLCREILCMVGLPSMCSDPSLRIQVQYFVFCAIISIAKYLTLYGCLMAALKTVKIWKSRRVLPISNLTTKLKWICSVCVSYTTQFQVKTKETLFSPKIQTF